MSSNIGIIGAGGIGQIHAEVLSESNDANVAGICDLNEERATELADSVGANPYTGHETLFSDESLDGVYVTTPPRTRGEILREAAERDIAIFCEKPLAATLEGGQAIVDLVDEYDATLMMGFNQRFREPIGRLKEVIDDGIIGDPVHAFATRMDFWEDDGKNWRTNPEQACGVTIESASHDIDQLRWIVGEIAGARGETMNTRPEIERFDDNMGAGVQFENGALGVLQVSWTSDFPHTRRGVIGTEGTVAVEGEGMWQYDRLEYRTRDGSTNEVIEYDHDAATDMGYHEMTAAFLDAVESDENPPVDVNDGMRALEVSLEILESASNSYVTR